MLFDNQRALAKPKAFLRPLLYGGFERCPGDEKIIRIGGSVPDFAVRSHAFDAEGIILKGHACPAKWRRRPSQPERLRKLSRVAGAGAPIPAKGRGAMNCSPGVSA